jgi:hypothetical protein
MTPQPPWIANANFVIVRYLHQGSGRPQRTASGVAQFQTQNRCARLLERDPKAGTGSGSRSKKARSGRRSNQRLPDLERNANGMNGIPFYLFVFGMTVA